MGKLSTKYLFVIGGQVYIRLEFLIKELCISSNLLKSTIGKQEKRRKNGKPSAKWLTSEDPQDGRKSIVLLSSIPEDFRTKYKLPNENDIRELEQLQKSSLIYNATSTSSPIETAIEYALNEGYVQSLPNYIKKYQDRKKAYRKAKKHALIEALINIEVLVSPKETRSAFSYCHKYRDILGWSNYRIFKRNLEKAEKNGVESLVVHGLTGKDSNNKKMNSKIIAIVEALYRDPRKYSYYQIHITCQAICVRFGIPAPSKSWISWYLSQTEVQNRLCEFRHGLKKYNDTVATYQPRLKPEHPGTLWYMDGTPVQFHHLTPEGKQTRLYLFLILDVCTGKVVGFSLSQSEDRYAILQALKSAVNLTGHLPGQLTFDNFTALKSEEIQTVFEKLNRRGVITNAAKVGNPQEKGNIERFFSSFQTRFQNLIDGYFGQGVTSSRKDARANPDFIKKYYDNGLRNEAEMKSLIIELIDLYNLNGTEANPKPNVKYKELHKPHVKLVDLVQFSLMFWNEKLVKVSRSMVKLVIQKQQYLFEIHDNDLKNILNGRTVRVRYDETDLSLIHLFDEASENFICECRQTYRVHQAAIEQTEEDVLAMRTHHAKKLSHRLHNHKKTEEITLRGKIEDPTDIVSPYSVLKAEALENENSELNKLLALQADVDTKLVRKYIPTATELKYIHKKGNKIQGALNDKIYQKNPTLKPFNPKEEKEE